MTKPDIALLEGADVSLPNFVASQFNLVDPPECDMILKGGITSGIVYPYAILQIATKYRLRSIGGTSVGAIAAAFAAAAEYARLNGRPEGYVLLKQYSDELPGRLLSLFQPSPELIPAVDSIKAAIQAGGHWPLVRQALLKGVPFLLLAGASLAAGSYVLQPNIYAAVLAAILGAILGGAYGAWRWVAKTFVRPLTAAITDLPQHNFGFCTGQSQPGNNDQPALTDWVYSALQHIAFGDPNHPIPLTFADLRGPVADRPLVDLKVVSTNLSMRRPHTLPRLGMAAGFIPEQWEKLFPRPVMKYLYQEGTRKWRRYAGAWLFPAEGKLPVIVGVRMSLSFPILFTAVPLLIEDTELPAIVKALGGKPHPRIRQVHFSDGGISSNFPIHMFDVPLPTRPTFAFSLEDLLWDVNEVKNRVALPSTASEGMGVQIKQIKSMQDFAWQILNSAKDWQDQLLSEITGQRERIVRVFLAKGEGGLNLDMSAEVSRRLMRWGYEAGCKFTDGGFDFDEHRWRRLLVLYKHLGQNLDAIKQIWSDDYGVWYSKYSAKVRSYKKVSTADRRRIASDLQGLVAAWNSDPLNAIQNLDEKLPKKAGALKVAARY